jgi:hypothetical protein
MNKIFCILTVILSTTSALAYTQGLAGISYVDGSCVSEFNNTTEKIIFSSYEPVLNFGKYMQATSGKYDLLILGVSDEIKIITGTTAGNYNNFNFIQKKLSRGTIINFSFNTQKNKDVPSLFWKCTVRIIKNPFLKSCPRYYVDPDQKSC